jgi:RHS repeat-associated protein
MKKLLRYPPPRLITFIGLMLFLGSLVVFFSLPGCGSSGDPAHTGGTSVTSDEKDTDASSEKADATVKHFGIKPFWTYDVNTIGGGGKAMTHLWGGNFLVQYTDISFPGRGLPVELRRTYNSQSTAKGSFGKGWTCIFDTHLIINESNVVLVDAYGTRYNFTNPQPDGDNVVYKAPAGRNTVFKKLADGTYTEKKKNGSTYIFDQTGKLLKIQHRNANNYIQFLYNDAGDPMAIQEASGRATLIQCDTNHRISTITDPEGRITSYHYSGGHLHRVIDPALHSTYFDYNEQGLLSVITNPRSFMSSFVYDDQSRITEFHDTLFTVSYQYFDDRTEVTDTNDHHLVYYLNAKGNNIQTIDSLGNSSYFTWDNKMNIIHTKNAKDQEVSYSYDGRGNVLSAVNSLFTLGYTYDSSNNLTSTTDGNGKITTFTYTPTQFDADGVLARVTTPLGRTVNFVYNECDEPITVVNAREKPTGYTFDVEGNITDVTDAMSVTTHMTYNLVGEALTVSDPFGRTTTFDYYANGLVHTVTTPGSDGTGATTEYKFDANGNRTKVIDALLRPTSYTFDEDDRMKTVTDAKGKVSAYTYEKGHLISTQDPTGFITTMSYDANDRMISRSNPITTESYTYDPLGLILTKDTGLGVIQYSYDELNRVNRITTPPGRTVSYSYDNNSNRTGSLQEDGTGSHLITRLDVSCSFDDDNRLVSRSKSFDGTTYERTSYDFDNNNNLVTLGVTVRRGVPVLPMWMPVPLNHDEVSFSFNYGYDDLDRQVSVHNSNGDVITADYDAVGNMTALHYPGNSNSIRVYDQENRIAMVQNNDPYIDQDPHSFYTAYNYSYDKVGNFISFEKNPSAPYTGGPKIFRYDRVDRLLYDEGAMMRFTYDDAGNKTRDIYTTTSTYIDYTYNGGHQLIAKTPGPGLTTDAYEFQYDANGNTSKKIWYAYGAPPETRGSIYTLYSYNPFNRITSKQYCADTSMSEGILHFIDREENLNYDDDNELIFSEQRRYDGVVDPEEYTAFDSTNIIHGYDGGKLIYKNMASGFVDNWLLNGAPFYDMEYYTYLNGIKVGATPFFSMAGDLNPETLKAIETRIEERARKQRESPFAASSARRRDKGQPQRFIRKPKGNARGGETDLTEFCLYDGQGNIVERANASAYRDFYNYRSYGEPLNSGVDDGYKGYEKGPCGAGTYGSPYEWELSYKTGVRIYDPASGRFLQPDPFKGYMSEPASQNPYMYCRGNPIKYSDPSGYYSVEYEGGAQKNQGFEDFVQNIGSIATDQEKQSLMDFGNLSPGQLANTLKWNGEYGPKIVVSGTQGSHVDKVTGNIYISERQANYFRTENETFSDKPGALAIYGVALLFHETVNYGHFTEDPANFRQNAFSIDQTFAHGGFNMLRYGQWNLSTGYIKSNSDELGARRGD